MIHVALTVTVQSVDQTDIAPGSDASFSVTATGIAPLSYQWQKDGVDLTDGGRITGANTTTLTIASVMKSDEGGYKCVVTDANAEVISGTAMLTVGKCIIIHLHTYICTLICVHMWMHTVNTHTVHC